MEQFFGTTPYSQKREGLTFFPPECRVYRLEVRKFVGFNDAADWDDEGIEKKRKKKGKIYIYFRLGNYTLSSLNTNYGRAGT